VFQHTGSVVAVGYHNNQEKSHLSLETMLHQRQFHHLQMLTSQVPFQSPCHQQLQTEQRTHQILIMAAGN
jgi:hypothetical protein